MLKVIHKRVYKLLYKDISNKLTEKPMHDKMNSALDPHCPRSSSSSSIARELIWKITLKNKLSHVLFICQLNYTPLNIMFN